MDCLVSRQHNSTATWFIYPFILGLFPYLEQSLGKNGMNIWHIIHKGSQECTKVFKTRGKDVYSTAGKSIQLNTWYKWSTYPTGCLTYPQSQPPPWSAAVREHFFLDLNAKNLPFLNFRPTSRFMLSRLRISSRQNSSSNLDCKAKASDLLTCPQLVTVIHAYCAHKCQAQAFPFKRHKQVKIVMTYLFLFNKFTTNFGRNSYE